jgi:hypothetical protein
VHEKTGKKVSNFLYSFAWKKMELVWEAIVRLKKLRYSIPFLEAVLKH